MRITSVYLSINVSSYLSYVVHIYLSFFKEMWYIFSAYPAVAIKCADYRSVHE